MTFIQEETVSERTIARVAENPSLYDKFSSIYHEEIPGAVGFFTVANPIAAAADYFLQVPAANGGLTRLVVTAAGLSGLQQGIGALRKKIYYHFDIYNRSEAMKRVADTAYGAFVGAAINPPFHELTKQSFGLYESTNLSAAIATGAIVGGLSGLIGWLGSDGFSYAWERKNIPSRNINVPGAGKIKSLGRSTKKKIALAATIISLLGTSGWYVHNTINNSHQDNIESILPD